MKSLISKICEKFSLSESEALYLVETAPKRYKVHMIDKRNGRGQRQIAQPTAEIKILQRWVVSEYLSKLPVHHAAKAYVQGGSIQQHAEPHARNAYLLKLDFTDFFPSIRGRDFLVHIKQFSDVNMTDARLLAKILFWYGKPRGALRLSIGAPSSPHLSNLMLYKFDEILEAKCMEMNATYTRYADDIAISTNTPRVLDVLHRFVIDLCKTLQYPRLDLNTGKTVFTSKKHNRQLTGLVLSNNGKASIGREKKRLIRSMANRYSLGQLDGEQTAHLRGLVSFAMSIDTEFVQSLERMLRVDAFTTLRKG